MFRIPPQESSFLIITKIFKSKNSQNFEGFFFQIRPPIPCDSFDIVILKGMTLFGLIRNI